VEAALVVAGASAVAGFILIPQAGLPVLIGCASLWFLAVVCEVFRGRFDGILLCWAGAFPFGYYFLSFPRDRSIVTLDRVAILLPFIGLFLIKPSALTAMPSVLRRAGLAWFAFIAVAAFTLEKSANIPNTAHMLFDGFLLPLLLGWCTIAGFDVRRRLPTLHTVVCISSILCAATAVAEIATGQDLFPNGNSVMFFAGSVARPNGPFATDDALAVVGAVSFFFLLFLRAALGRELSAGRRVLHSIGLAAAIGMALMPLFRSVAITLLLVLIIDTFWEQGATRRAWSVMLMLASVGLIFILPLFVPDMFEDRSSGANVYGRVAQYEQSLRVFVEHPLLGVGFSNFNDFVEGEPRYVASYEGVSSVDSPHSNLAAALAETGILGFVPYVMAHIFLFQGMWRLRRLSSSGYLVWKYYVYLLLTYWITGLTETTHYSPITLWYVFVTAVACKYALTESDPVQPAEGQVADVAVTRSTSG
jgi:O-antigen ligase